MATAFPGQPPLPSGPFLTHNPLPPLSPRVSTPPKSSDHTTPGQLRAPRPRHCPEKLPLGSIEEPQALPHSQPAGSSQTHTGTGRTRKSASQLAMRSRQSKGSQVGAKWVTELPAVCVAQAQQGLPTGSHRRHTQACTAGEGAVDSFPGKERTTELCEKGTGGHGTPKDVPTSLCEWWSQGRLPEGGDILSKISPTSTSEFPMNLCECVVS